MRMEPRATMNTISPGGTARRLLVSAKKESPDDVPVLTIEQGSAGGVGYSGHLLITGHVTTLRFSFAVLKVNVRWRFNVKRSASG